jgi:hypothetical protein
MIDPSIVVGWSSHKLDVIVGIIAVITRLNVRFSSSSSGLWFNEGP